MRLELPPYGAPAGIRTALAPGNGGRGRSLFQQVGAALSWRQRLVFLLSCRPLTGGLRIVADLADGCCFHWCELPELDKQTSYRLMNARSSRQVSIGRPIAAF